MLTRNFISFANGLLSLVLALLLGYTSIRLGLSLWSPPAETPHRTPGIPAQAQNNTVRHTELDINAILNAHLFGTQQTKAPPPTVPVKLPETRLKLELLGILYSDHAEDAQAIIRVAGGEAQIYTPQKAVQGAKIEAVYPDHVVLLHEQRREVLRLKAKEGIEKHLQSASVPARKDNALATYRQKVLEKPESLYDYIRFTPARTPAGDFSGYLIRPGKEAGLFKKTGLQAGDMITGINGTPLDSPMSAIPLLPELSQARSIELEVVRRGQKLFVRIDLD